MDEAGVVPDFASDVEVALAAAAAGARVVREAYGGPVRRFAKSGSDFTTTADLGAERAILDVIASARPDDDLLSEEAGGVLDGRPRRWLVDPLCGTVNFAARTPLAAVNVALVEGTRTLACVSADPVADEVFWSDGGRTRRRWRSTDRPVQPSAESGLIEVNCDGPPDTPFVGPQLLADPAFRSRFVARSCRRP